LSWFKQAFRRTGFVHCRLQGAEQRVDQTKEDSWALMVVAVVEESTMTLA
jgi:hypothetical protein